MLCPPWVVWGVRELSAKQLHRVGLGGGKEARRGNSCSELARVPAVSLEWVWTILISLDEGPMGAWTDE